MSLMLSIISRLINVASGLLEQDIFLFNVNWATEQAAF